MKRFILLFGMLLFGLMAYSQERTVTTIVLDNNSTGKYYSYYDYIGNTTYDILIPTTRDTIDVPFDVRKSQGYNYSIITKFSPRTTADTTVTQKIYGRNSENESWTLISTNVSSAVTTSNIVQTINSSSTATIASATDLIKQTVSTNQDTITVAARTITYSIETRYRYLLVRNILTGDDHTGNGVKIDEIELKLWL